MYSSKRISSMPLGERLAVIPKCNVDFVSLLRSSDSEGRLEGLCKGYPFMISYQKGDFLLLSIPNADEKPAWGEAFTALKVACEGFMDADPICQYTTDERKLLTLEWELNHPERVLSDIINNGGHRAKKQASDIILFGGRKLSDYESVEVKQRNAEIEAERIKNTRIYGVDTGGYDKDVLDKLTEWELFLEYYSITKIAWNIDHSLSHSWISISDTDRANMLKERNEMQYGIEYLLYYISKRLEIAVPEPEVDQHIQPDRDTFMRWYGFYDSHFTHKLSKEDWETFETARKNHEDVSGYLPTGDWHDYR